MDTERLERALQQAERYLFDNLEHGFWIDFTACHGGSTCWTTSYVARHLAENPENLDRLLFVKDRIKFNQRMDGGWGYNHTAVSDTDTTLNCLLFLHNFSDTKDIINGGLEFLLKHYNPEVDGFSTYTEDNLKQYARGFNLEGWCLPSIEVTASVTNALIKLGYNGKEIQQASEFIASQQDDDGSWKSYWWTSDIYPLSKSVELLERFSEYKDNTHKALKYLIDKKEGFGWTNDFNRKYDPFYTAIALRTLLKDTDSKFLEKEFDNLLNKQNSDGSFGSGFIFRIPRYNVTDASQIKNWSIEAPHKNSVYGDNKRFFTTATVYSTLLKHLKYLGS